MSELDPVIRAIVSICILVFSAKILGELFVKIKIPSVLGELFAGVLLGPYAFGSIIAINGVPIIEINDFVRAFGEIGGILILFAAGLEMTFTEFRHVGSASFITGTTGVVVPFLMGYGITALLGYDTMTSMVVAAALTATSISITSLVLMELGKSRNVESRVIVGAAVVDDVLGLAILGVVVSFISGSASAINPLNVIIVILESLALWGGLVLIITPIFPRLMNITARGKSEDTVEAAATASCFGAAAIAALMGLSPIVGAFAAGMAVASSKAIEQIRDYARKISVIFSPVFFALAGAAFNIRAFITSDLSFYLFFVTIVIVAIASKLIGCGLPAAKFLKSGDKGLKVGVGMISRGEVGLIVAGVAISAGAITENVYSAIVGMVMITTILTPIMLKLVYERDGKKQVPLAPPQTISPTPSQPVTIPSGSATNAAGQ
jgi:Kef-type K+ transport system membrane component KefB